MFPALSDFVSHSEFLKEYFLFHLGTRGTGPHILLSIILETGLHIWQRLLCVVLFAAFALAIFWQHDGNGSKTFSYPSFIFLCSSQSRNTSVCHHRAEWHLSAFQPVCSHVLLLRAHKCSRWAEKEPAHCRAAQHPGFLHVLWAWKSCGWRHTCKRQLQQDRQGQESCEDAEAWDRMQLSWFWLG